VGFIFTMLWCVAMATNTTNHAKSNFLDTAEAAAYLGVPVRMIARLRYERRIAAYRLGRHLRFKVSDLDAWAESNRDEPVGA
jgi:excisionase family DNA binding protein